jgi:hypothetical protein
VLLDVWARGGASSGPGRKVSALKLGRETPAKATKAIRRRRRKGDDRARQRNKMQRRPAALKAQ